MEYQQGVYLKSVFARAVDAIHMRAKALETSILFQSKEAVDGNVTQSGYMALGRNGADDPDLIAERDKDDLDAFLFLTEQQRRIQEHLDELLAELEVIAEEIRAIDRRRAQIRIDLDYIEQSIDSADDLVDASGNWKPEVRRMLEQAGKENLSKDDAYIYLTQRHTQALYDEDAVLVEQRQKAVKRFEDKNRDLEDKLARGEDAGLDVDKSRLSQQEVIERLNRSEQEAITVSENVKSDIQNDEGLAGADFLLNGAMPS